MKKKFTFLIAALMLLSLISQPMRMWGQAAVGTTMWAETWTGATTATGGNNNATPSANYGHGTTVYNNGTVTYTQSANTVYVRNENLADGSIPELMLTSGQTWTISNIPTGQATELTLTYKSNNNKSSVTCSTSGASISGSSKSYTITTGGAETITLVFGCSSNTRIDDVLLTVKTAGGSSPITYTVTFDAGDGVFVGNGDFPNTSNTKAAGTYTLPSATPASGYTFDGWKINGEGEALTGSYTVSGDVDIEASYTETGGGSTATKTLTQSALGLTGSYTTNTQKTIDGITYVYSNLMKNNDNIQAAASTGTIKNTTAYPGDITSVAITHSGTARATNINGSADGTNWTQVATGSGSITADFTGKGYKYFQITRGSNAAYWTKIEITYSTIATVETPSISPNGGAVAMPQSVTITCTTDDASIYYTTNGSTPTTGSTLYNGAFNIESACTVKAIAVKDGMNNSSIAAAEFTQLQVADPVVSPNGGAVAMPQSVTITCATEGASILYSIDGTEPSVSYTAPFEINSGCTVKTKATKSGYLPSNVVSATFTQATVSTPIFSLASGTYYGSQDVTISCATEGASILYSIDGSEPSQTYSAAVTISSNCTLKAKATKTGCIESSVAQAAYVIEAPFVNVLSQNWEDEMNGWAFVSITGNEVWSISTFANNNFAKISGRVSSTNYANEDWIISPAFNLNAYNNAKLSFTSARNNQNGEVIKVYFTNNYTNNPSTTTWNELSCTLPSQPNSGYSAFVSSGDISLSSYTGTNCRIGFKYTSTTSAAATWEVDDILLQGQENIVPSITADPTSMTFTYVSGGSAADQILTISGDNLEDDITITLSGSNFAISEDGSDWSQTTLTIAEDDAIGEIKVRFNSGITATGESAGTITLSTEGTDDVVVNLTGTVTNQIYAINVDDDIAGGTIEADLASAEAGATVTLTAAPDAAYTFGTWTVYKDDMETTVTVTDNQFEMPDCVVYVTATFNAKPTYAITCVASPVAGGEIEASPASAYEGQTVTLTYLAEAGYNLSSIVITKTSDQSATGITPATSGDDYTFTMPGYAVTATATFVPNFFEGSFFEYSGDLAEGDYLIVYDGNAMNNTVSSKRFQFTSVTPSEGVVTNPDRTIVWHIAQSGDYWTIYNEKENKYAASTGNKNEAQLLADGTDNKLLWTSSGTSAYEFINKQNTTNNVNAYLRKNASYGFACYANSTGGALTLYKYRAPHTITFNGNGGTYNDETTYTQTVFDGIATNLNANQFTKASAAFAGWATTADGDVVYANEASVTLTADLTLYAIWAEQCTVTYSTNGNTTTQTVAKGTAIGTLLDADADYIPAGYTFKGWYNGTYALSDDEPTYVSTDMVVNNDVTLYAVFAIGTDSEGTESASLEILPTDFGGSYASSDGDHTKSGITFNTSNVYQAASTKIQFKTNSGYLYNKTPLDITSVVLTSIIQGSFTVYSGQTQHPTTGGSITGENNVYTITNASHKYITVKAGDNTPQVGKITINYNKPITITTYSNYCTSVADITENVNIDKEGNLTNDITISSGALSIESPITITSGNTLTVNGTGVIANDDPANLIIEEGGQLICNNSVAATVIKTVSAAAKAKDVYGWNTISSPVHTDANDYVTIGAETTVNLTANAYDMFAYDEENMMWLNQKPGSGATGFGEMYAGQGYIYRNSAATDISFVGNTNAGDVTITLTNKSSGNLAGFNLIGNPYPHSIKKGSGQAIDNAYLASGFYVLSDGKWLAYTDNEEIVAKQGILVKTSTDDNSLTIKDVPYTAPAGKYHNDNIKFMVSNSQHEDVVYAWFDKGIGLDKINHRDPDAPMLYINQEGKNYAIAMMTDDVKAFGLSFKSKTTSNYTLSYKTQGEFNYLHVVDRMTGEDVDMLLEGAYSFVGSPKDNENRFIVRLGYMPDYSDDNDEIFAYQSGNDIYVSGQGELQIFDVMGRFVMSERVNGATTISADALSKGVYVLRIVDSEIKTQKMVVR